MNVSIKEYAAQAGISVQAAHKRLKTDKYSRFLTIAGSGRKAVNTAIFDLETGVKPISTDSTGETAKVERESTTFSTFSTEMVENSTEQVEKSTTDSTEKVESMVEGLKENSTFSTDSTAALNHDTAVLTLKLEYSQRETERLESHVEALRQQIETLTAQLNEKDSQIAALNERLRESHILIQTAQQKRHFPLLDIFRRKKGDGVNE